MRNLFLFSFVLLLQQITVAQTVTIKGIAPDYVGKKVEIFAIEDYISMQESIISTARVAEDSTFSTTFNCEDIQKVIVKSNNNKGFLYIQPGREYNIYLPNKNQYDPFRPAGNIVELHFLDLDSTDINYKILGFQRWIDMFIGDTYHLRTSDNMEFVERLDLFKANVERVYAKDTSENAEFLQTFVKFSIAGLDNVNHTAQRNRYEKHDFYIKYSPVKYKNDAYMEYISGFYQELMPRLSNAANESVYEGILHSSPSMVMNALGSEYTLINMRIREIVMVQALSEVFYSDDYPQTNIITILDSVANHGLFEANGVIAKNVLSRLTDLVPGGKAPDLVFSAEGLETKTLLGMQGKHLYIHAFDPTSNANMQELELLKGIEERYRPWVQIVSVYKPNDTIPQENLAKIAEMPWDVYPLSKSNSFWKNYQIEAMPHYILIDAAGYLVSTRALGPTPNGEYETIDKVFYDIMTAYEMQNKR